MQLQRFKSFHKDIGSFPSIRYEKQGVEDESNIAFLLIQLITKRFDDTFETHAGDEENIINKKPLAGSQVPGVPATSTVTKQTYGVVHKVKS